MSRMAHITHLIVHGAFTPPDMDIGVDEIRQWHTAAPNNFDDIGYHVVIRRNAEIEYGRSLDVQGAHAPPKNDQSLGICLIGGKHPTEQTWQQNYTYPQLARLGFVIVWLKMMYPDTVVCGHKDVTTGRECPGFDVASWWDARNRRQ